MAKPLVTDDLWQFIEPLLPKPKPRSPKGGRPPIANRTCLEGILFVLKTGIAWEDLPPQFGCSGMTCWRRLRDWQWAGIWEALHQILLSELASSAWHSTTVGATQHRTRQWPGRVPLGRRAHAELAASVQTAAHSLGA